MLRILTLVFGELPYACDSTVINRAYAARYGLEHQVLGACDATDRDPIWCKVLYARQALEEPHVDRVLVMDADAVFARHEEPPEKLTDFLGDRDLLVGEDYVPGLANTGVFLVNNTPGARAILDEWWRLPAEFPELGFTWPLEERAFNQHILPKYRPQIRLVQRAELDLVRGYVRHYLIEPTAQKTRRLARARTELEAALRAEGG